jgi:hypothetical protein
MLSRGLSVATGGDPLKSRGRAHVMTLMTVETGGRSGLVSRNFGTAAGQGQILETETVLALSKGARKEIHAGETPGSRFLH